MGNEADDGKRIRKRCPSSDSYSQLFVNSLLDYVEGQEADHLLTPEEDCKNTLLQHQESIQLLKETQLLQEDDQGALQRSIFAPVVWSLRKFQPESIALKYITPLLLKVFHDRRNERDDINMFLIFSHIASRKLYHLWQQIFRIYIPNQLRSPGHSGM